MNNEIKYTRKIFEKPTEKEIDEVFDILVAYNLSQKNYIPFTEFLYKYYDETGKLMGGIYFETRADWMEINYLAIKDEYRKQGLGGTILKDAEDYAISKGCKKCLLSTFAFQARGFYEKYGYKLMYTQEFENPKSSRYFMEKRLV